MNPNIIYNLCPYLDVKSMLCLSAAYPQWSAIVHDYLKKKFWKLQLMDFVSMCGSFDPVILLSRTGRVECKAKREQWEIIPVSYWKYVPFEVLNISSMEIYQFDVSKDGTIHFPDEMFDMLTRVTTSELTIKFDRCDTARRVLETIHLRPDSFVTLVDMSAELSEDSILQHSAVANCRRMDYKGKRNKLWRELRKLLNADYVTVYVTPFAPIKGIVKKIVEGYLNEQAGKVHCNMDRRNTYELENVDRDAPGRTNQLRLINVKDESSMVARNMRGVRIIVNNLK